MRPPVHVGELCLLRRTSSDLVSFSIFMRLSDAPYAFSQFAVGAEWFDAIQ